MDRNRQTFHSWIAGLTAGLVYFLTSAPTITWVHNSQDSGELASVAATLGIAHPTGYPLYTLLGWVTIKLLGWLDPGRAMVLLSVACAAVAIGVIARTASLAIRILWNREVISETQAGWFGFLVAMSVMIHPIVWSQAVVCEVYALAFLLQTIVWFLLVKYLVSRNVGSGSENGGEFTAIGLITGLILAHHVAGVSIILPVLLIFIFIPPKNVRKTITRFLFSIIPGLIFYFYLPIRSMTNPRLDWGNTESWGNFVKHVTAFQYRGNVFGVDMGEFIRRLTSSQLVDGWGILVLVLAIAGLLVLLINRKRKLLPFSIGMVLFLIWVLVFALSYNVSDYEVFTYPLIAPIALLIVTGIASVVIRLARVNKLLPWVFLAILIIFIGFDSYQRWIEIDASNPLRNAAANFAAREIPLLPEDAIVITNTDGQLFSLMYGITCGVPDPFSGEIIGPRDDIDVLTPYWILTNWFYENNTGSDIEVELWDSTDFNDLAGAVRDFIDLNLLHLPVFVDGGVLTLIQVEGEEYKFERETALIRIIPDH